MTTDTAKFSRRRVRYVDHTASANTLIAEVGDLLHEKRQLSDPAFTARALRQYQTHFIAEIARSETMPRDLIDLVERLAFTIAMVEGLTFSEAFEYADELTAPLHERFNQ
ncbi:hypothetical protein [Buttiauxella agrestis]|uniref:hypothetical protein n=1 Tax=Buttiauxella agrestis TaxID=82977 RepID=UPI001561909D|nr:hypothetical protein [Buttiauxella agrestis]BCG08770.1 hypothetical protein BADSM9389_14290 [Buttiauxella agrestis]